MKWDVSETHPKRDEPAEAVPTITTVARLANVSVASASRVLNGIRTSPATLARVTEAAEAVDYAPNAAARSLRSRRTGQIAFVMPDVANPVYTTMVGSIQEVARARGWRLMLHSTGADSEDELAMVRDLRHRFVDGMILASLNLTDAHAYELRRAAAPVIVIGRPTRGTPVDTVRAYSRKGAAEAVRHLYAVGRRRIALVNGPEQTAPGASRRRGYLDGLHSCGLRPDDALMEVTDAFTIEPGRRAAERLLACARPDAMFCANDLLAVGALSALRKAGRHVPGDVALVGMDDTPLVEVTWPPLTSIDLGSAARARMAAELLLERIARPSRETRVLGVEPRLVVRASSAVTA
ncbi:MAG: LacI family DNA-binding transcriptional regulator [Actinobacteria bacterium]|nr:LacI family DNA-binding transcriptional regulator [Actinomycetota bacterium]